MQAPEDEARIIAKVKEAGIAVVSLPMCNMYLQDRAPGRTPRWRGVTPLHELKAAGVPVMIASDNTRDPFYAYGDLDLIEVLREAHAHPPARPFRQRLGQCAWRGRRPRSWGMPSKGVLAAGRPGRSHPVPRARLDRVLRPAAGGPHRAGEWQGDRPDTAGLSRTRSSDGQGRFVMLDRFQSRRHPGRPQVVPGSIGGLALYDGSRRSASLGQDDGGGSGGAADARMLQPHDRPLRHRRAEGAASAASAARTIRRWCKQKSRDFFWYSPVLKRQLDHVTADIVVSPASEAQVLEMLAAAHALGIPVTPRGTGTGNYGQAMPLSGGVLLDLSGFNKVTAIEPGRYVAEPGAIMARIDDETRAHSRQELRLHPSTYQTASIGGFIAGGSGGVGSIKWGGLRDWGNIIRLKVATMEASPRILELTGEDLHKVAHAYGTNGIITEVEMPLGAGL